MWVLKCRGETYYVNHVTCELPWSTKETPDNSHTKGSIKVKRCLVKIDEENCATISELTKDDELRLNGQRKVIRIITLMGSKLNDFLKNQKHGGVKAFGGACTRTWYVAEIYSEKVLLLAEIAIPDMRILKPNEDYYKWYDKYQEDYVDEDLMDWDDLYED